MIKPDALWKGLLEGFFEEFLHFFYPVESGDVDWSVAPEFMDKELAKISPKSPTKGRTADKLVKVRLKNGQQRWVLIHVEVQGYPDPDFAHRMYQMRIRIGERYGIEVVALAILTDEDPAFCPEIYEERTWDNQLTYRWRIYKLLQNPPSPIVGHQNIFGAAMSFAYRRLKQGRLKDEFLLELKLGLIEEFSKIPMSAIKMQNLQTFVESYVSFANPKFDHIFEQKLSELNKIEPVMSLFELKMEDRAKKAERQGRKKGRQEGHQEGRQEGRQEGHQEGRQEGHQEGRQEGHQEGRQEGIEIGMERLLLRGFSPAEIVDIFDVTIEKVVEIQNRLVVEGKLAPK